MVVIWFSYFNTFCGLWGKILINFLFHIHEKDSSSLAGFEQVISRPHIVIRCGECALRKNVHTSFLRLQADLLV